MAGKQQRRVLKAISVCALVAVDIGNLADMMASLDNWPQGAAARAALADS
jgi:hypothetical protein